MFSTTYSGEPRKQQDAADLLCQKFGVTNVLDLVQAQDIHIQRLEGLRT